MNNFAIKCIKIGNICEVSNALKLGIFVKFWYFLYFSVSLELTLGDY